MGLHLNIKKTKVMTTAGNGTVHITIDNEEIESVQDFPSLDPKLSIVVTQDQTSTEELHLDKT